ncbi:MAG: hypothetical protein KGS44_11385 [Alphaproteobacteria bacterium]|jgi:hypothetical protein|nr:hypothetical protein [Alphaproteobacteria bacterium]
MSVLYWISALGLVIGAGMGLYAMIRPSWASWLVRLKADDARPGGYAEFRGTYGGLFFFTHAMPLAFLIVAMTGSIEAHGFAAPVFMIMSSVCVVAWWGTAVGRMISVIIDRQGLPFNLASVGFEVGLGLLIGAPLLAELAL